MKRSEIIPVGEPGCYVCEGHLSLDDIFDMICTVVVEYEEGLLSIEAPRHSWMIVTPFDDHDTIYREVLPGSEGADPYTIIAVKSHWKKPEAAS